MSKRSSWCEFSNEERKYMKKRDNNRCVICGKSGALEAMHIFVSRAHGGRGIRTNGVMGCCKCHRIMDNAIGDEEIKLSKQYMTQCEKYLIEKENIQDIKQLKEELVYHKINNEFDMTMIINKMTSNQKHCKGCIFLVKNKVFYSTIPTYYCKYKKICLNKTTKACKKYKEKNEV